MILTDLAQFVVQRQRKHSKWIRVYNGLLINITEKRVDIRCDNPACTTPGGKVWSGWLRDFFDKTFHECRSCRIKGDKNPRGPQGKTPWNKGQTKETNATIAAQGRRHGLRMSGEQHPCYGKCGSLHHSWGIHVNVGAQNARYKDGKSYERWSQRHDLPARQWAKAVKERDRFMCQACGSTKGHLVSHHLYDYATHPELRYRLANGICLCRHCHDAFHTWNGGQVKPCTAEAYVTWLRPQQRISA